MLLSSNQNISEDEMDGPNARIYLKIKSKCMKEKVWYLKGQLLLRGPLPLPPLIDKSIAPSLLPLQVTLVY